jgi:hypothetical protein
LNCTPNTNLKDYIKAKVFLNDENNELIEEVEYFEELHVDKD